MHISVLSPDKTFFEGEIKSVKVPGELGQFQVLNNHSPIVSSLGHGDVVIEKTGGELITMTINKGFIEVLDNNISLLIEEVEAKN